MSPSFVGPVELLRTNSTGHTKGELSKANRYVGKLYLLSMARAARNSMSVCVCVGAEKSDFLKYGS